MDKTVDFGTAGSVNLNHDGNIGKERKERIEALLSRQRSETAEMTSVYDT